MTTTPTGASVASAWVLFYAERVPEGPDLIGPFPTKAAALAYADTQNLDWSEHYAQRLWAPVSGDQAARRG